MFAFLFTIMPALQLISTLLTVWGFANTAQVADTVVTYGASGPDAPQMADWVNSVGSIVLGVGGMVGTWFAQRKNGSKSELYLATVDLISHPTSAAALLRLTFAVVSILEDRWGGNDASDQEAIAFIKKWLLEKVAAEKQPPALNTK